MNYMKLTRWDVKTHGVYSKAKLRARMEEGGFMVWSYRFPPTTFYPDHTHDRDRTFGVIEGRLAVSMYNDTVILHVGDTLLIPKDVEHSVHVVGAEDVAFLDASKN